MRCEVLGVKCCAKTSLVVIVAPSVTCDPAAPVIAWLKLPKLMLLTDVPAKKHHIASQGARNDMVTRSVPEVTQKKMHRW